MKLLVSQTFENLKLVSEANNTDHWREKHLRKKNIQWILSSLKEYIKHIHLPCIVKIVRIGPRPLDSDNLQMSAKSVRDYIASLLIPGKRVGRADDDTRIEWQYFQEKGKPKQYALRIEIYS